MQCWYRNEKNSACHTFLQNRWASDLFFHVEMFKTARRCSRWADLEVKKQTREADLEIFFFKTEGSESVVGDHQTLQQFGRKKVHCYMPTRQCKRNRNKSSIASCGWQAGTSSCWQERGFWTHRCLFFAEWIISVPITHKWLTVAKINSISPFANTQQKFLRPCSGARQLAWTSLSRWAGARNTAATKNLLRKIFEEKTLIQFFSGKKSLLFSRTVQCFWRTRKWR